MGGLGLVEAVGGFFELVVGPGRGVGGLAGGEIFGGGEF